jgi:protein O-GlcNAc transferase
MEDMFRTLKKMMKATPYTKSAIADGLPSPRESTDIVLEECRQRFSLGDLDGAEKAARAILVMSSEIGEAWYHLGLIAHRRGDNTGALEMLRKAVDLSPHHAEAQNHYGNALRVQGRFHEALEMYSRASVLKSGYAAPLYNMGLVHTAMGQPIEAESFFQKALEIDPAFSAALISLGVVRLDQEKYREAEELFRKALLKNPESLEALNNLGIALVRLKRCEEALEVCNTAVAIAPKCAEVHNTLGLALRDSGRLDEAIASYRRALEINPECLGAINNLGSALRETGHLREAIAALRGALVLKPTYAFAWHNLGITHREMGELEEAVFAYRRALENQPGNAITLKDLAGALVAQGEIEGAVEAYRKAMESDPRLSIAYSNLLLTMQYSPHYSEEEIYKESRRWEQLHCGEPKSDHRNNREPFRRLRVGYVSPDFRCHSVSYFLQALIDNHSRSEVAIVCYSDVIVPDENTEFYRKHADGWRSIVGLGDDKVAEIVIEDRIDILVDLAGHTGHRLPLFARKPAPVQITWLGYPGTTGLAAIDYRFSDDIADPEGESDLYHAETVSRLPGVFLCYTAPADAPEVAQLPSASSGRITFGSLNNISKITKEVVALWCDLLSRVLGFSSKIIPWLTKPRVVGMHLLLKIRVFRRIDWNCDHGLKKSDPI